MSGRGGSVVGISEDFQGVMVEAIDEISVADATTGVEHRFLEMKLLPGSLSSWVLFLGFDIVFGSDGLHSIINNKADSVRFDS